MEKTGASNRTVELAASELPAFFNALPRLLTENLTVKVSGTLNEHLYLSNFYGSGGIWIEGFGGCAFQKGLDVRNCSIGITLKNLALSGRPEAQREIVSFQRCRYISMQECDVEGTFPDSSQDIGVRVNLSTLAGLDNCGVKNCSIAVMAGSSSIVTVSNDNGNRFLNNGAGLSAYGGGILLLSGQTPELLGGSSNTKSGGLIVKANGTLL